MAPPAIIPAETDVLLVVGPTPLPKLVELMGTSADKHKMSDQLLSGQIGMTTVVKLGPGRRTYGREIYS
jgi:hypothetical protein